MRDNSEGNLLSIVSFSLICELAITACRLTFYLASLSSFNVFIFLVF